MADGRGRAHPHGQPHPADPGDGAHRDPRPVAWSTRRRPTAGRSSPTWGSTTRRPSPRPSAASCCARARSSTCTTGWPTSTRWPAGCGALVPEARVAVAHGQMDEGTPRAGGARLLGAALRRAGLHDDHRVGHRHADGQHAGRRPGRPPRPGPAAPAPGPGRPGQPAGLRLPVPPGRPGPDRAGLRAAAHDRRAHRARLGLQDRHARPRDPRGGEPARPRPVRPHRRRGLRPLRAAGGRGGGRGEGRAAAGRRRSRSTCPATPTCRRTTWPPRTPGWRPTAGWPRSPRRARWTTWPRSGPTVRPAAAGRRGAAALARLRVECLRTGVDRRAPCPGPRGRGAGPAGPDLAGRAPGQRPGPPAPPGPGVDPARGARPAGGAARPDKERPADYLRSLLADLVPAPHGSRPPADRGPGGPADSMRGA